MGYKATIGLEVHAELKTASKMFCGCKNAPHGSEPNTLICSVCLAHPGTLPVPNQTAIEHVLLFGRAVNANQATYTEFDRKNYFYPDIPKAYQISQYQFPFLSGGSLAGVELTRVHLEEDTARSQHNEGDYSLVDFNRAGVPLMELVTEPVIHDAETAMTFAKELQLLLRTLGISDANMEKGEMRVEANISISDTDELGTKVEVKNLNSFKVVGQAIEYEIKRHQEVLESGGEIKQETRGWDENKGKTFSQRSKETAKDYRYFPDPDLPKINTAEIPAFEAKALDEKMPELPEITRKKYHDLGITSEQIEFILANQDLNIFVKKLAEAVKEKATFDLAVNYLMSDVVALTAENNTSVSDLNQGQFVTLMQMTADKKLNSRTAKDVLALLVKENIDVATYTEENNLLQVSDDSALLEIVTQVIADNESVVAEYKAGKEASVKYLVGQGMKLSKGTADPQRLLELLQENI